MIKSKRNGVEANILTSQDVGGGGSKLLNDPQSYGPYDITTQGWSADVIQVPIEESGLYFCQADFSWGEGAKIPEPENIQFRLFANGKMVSIQNAKATYEMFGVSINSIAKIQAGKKVEATVNTGTAGAKFKVTITTIKLRGDEDA